MSCMFIYYFEHVFILYTLSSRDACSRCGYTAKVPHACIPSQKSSEHTLSQNKWHIVSYTAGIDSMIDTLRHPQTPLGTHSTKSTFSRTRTYMIAYTHTSDRPLHTHTSYILAFTIYPTRGKKTKKAATTSSSSATRGPSLGPPKEPDHGMESTCNTPVDLISITTLASLSSTQA